MKKSSVIVTSLRALFIYLAYQHVITPKAGMIAPGTGRAIAQGAKSVWHTLKTITKEKLKAVRT